MKGAFFIMKIHITKQGETVETVAGKYAVSTQDLIGINPHINMTSDLVPGLKLKIPDVARTDKTNDNIEKYYPNLEQHSKEQAVPIGLKPFPTATAHPETTAHHVHPEAKATTHHTHPEKAATAHHAHPESTSTTAHPHPIQGHTPEHTTPWSHLKEQTAPLNTEPETHYPWSSHPVLYPHDSRAFIPPIPYYPYPAYPYPYAYPYGYGLPFGGFGHGWHGGHGHGGHGGHGHGGHGGHGGHHR